MIIVLPDKLEQLLLSRSQVCRSCAHGIDVWNLCPNDESKLVGQIVNVLVMLVMRQSDGGRADLSDESKVAVVILRRRGPTAIEQILVTIDAMKVEIFIVQKKTLLCIDSKGSETDWLNDHVACLAAGRNNGVCRVDVRIVAALPQARIGDAGLDAKRSGRFGFGVDDSAENRQHSLVGANNGRLNFDILGGLIAIVDVAANRQRRRCGADFAWRKKDARRRVVAHDNVHGLNRENMHAAIDPTEKSKIGRERCDIGKRSVTPPHCKDIIPANSNNRGHFEPEHSEATTMLTEVSAIDPDVGYCVDAIEVNENLAASFTGIDEEMTAVEARSAIIVVAAVLAVAGIPGVRDRDDIPTLVVEGFLFCASHIAFDKTPTIDQRRVASDLRRWRERLHRSHVE